MNKTQLEEMLEKQGVDEGRILENCRVKVKTIDYDPNKEILSIDIQVLQQQDA